MTIIDNRAAKLAHQLLWAAFIMLTIAVLGTAAILINFSK